MKKKITTRSLSLILAMAILLSCFGVFTAFAAEQAETQSTTNPNGTENVYTGINDRSLYMKVGSEYALESGSRVKVNAPVKVDGVVYVAIEQLAYIIGYSMQIDGNTNTVTLSSGSDTAVFTVGSKSADLNSGRVSLNYAPALVGDYPVVALNDISIVFNSVCTDYSSMGLLSISKTPNLISSTTVEEQVELMKAFLFDSIDTSLNKVDSFAVSDMKTTTHPYLVADQSQFDKWRAIYKTENPSDPVLKSYLVSLAEEGAAIYKKMTGNTPDTEAKLTNSPTQTLGSNNGYDVGGRLAGGAETHATNILSLAYAYQITGNNNYALLAYEYAAVLGGWSHWGPNHFLNTADTMGPYALAYDLLYNVWGELDGQTAGSTTVDRDVIRDALVKNAIVPSFYAVQKIECPWPCNTSAGIIKKATSYFTEHTNNWNPVCTSGVVTAALALVGDTLDLSSLDISISNESFTYETVKFTSLGDHTGLEKLQDYAEYLINNTLYTLPKNGLGLYAPDGSYSESPTYWAYGTCNFFELCAILDITTGSDKGLMDTWGMDRTCYYALNVQSSDYKTWNYHDTGDPVTMNTGNFPYVAYALGNPELATIRKNIIENGGGTPGIWDLVYYDIGTNNAVKLELQYYMEGIDGYVIRDSWDKGATYVGIMGGNNQTSHGQIDSGSFVYHNNGKIWFGDIGTENYNTHQNGNVANDDQVADLGGMRYGYYRMNAEGNNTLVLTSDQTNVPFGQMLTGGARGVMYKTFSNTYGAYALIDNTSVYNSQYKTNVVSAKRGMLFTGDRKTVVIQDEVVFEKDAGAQTMYWFGHIMEDAMISNDGRTAYLSDGETIIRASIVSDNADLRFTLMDTYTFVLDVTHDKNFSTDNGGVAEYDRTGFKKLAIKCENIEERLNLAVVIEQVALNENVELGYEWQNMDEWVPTYDGRKASNTVIDMSANGDEFGEVAENLGNLTLDSVEYESGFEFVANESTDKSSYAFLSPSDALTSGYIGSGAVVAEIDLFTSSTVPSGAALTLSSVGGDILSVELSSVITNANKWHRLSILIDVENEIAYLYVDAIYSKSIAVDIPSFEKLAVVISTPEGTLASGSSISVDNLLVRCFNSEYKTANLTAALKEDGSIRNWSDRSRTYHISEPVAAIGPNKYIPDYSSDIDTPIVDFDTRFVYNFEDIQTEVKAGEVVTILKSSTEPIEISVQCTVYNQGFEAVLVSNNLVASTVDKYTTKFAPGQITVTWYGYDGVTVVKTETVSASNKLTPPSGSSVAGYGELVEIYNGGTYSYQIMNAWSNKAGGEALSKDGFIVTESNCNFYLVGSEPETLMYIVESTSGDITQRYDMTNFVSDLANSNNERIVLTSDVALGSSLTESSFNLYLNGYTLQVDGLSGHLMSVTHDGKIANIYGGGGRIVNTTGGNFFYLANASSSITIENATIELAGTIADLRKGTVNLTNVDIIKSNDSYMFAVNDRYGTDSSRTVNLSGVDIKYANEDYRSYVFQVINSTGTSKPTTFNLTDGTNIFVPYATLLNVSGANIVFNTTDSIIKVGEVTSNSSITKISYGNRTGLSFKPEQAYLASECVVALGSDVSDYMVLKSGEYATVTWVAGTEQIEEYWVDGSLPKASSANVASALSSLTPSSSAKKYSYLIPGAVKGRQSLTIEAVEVSKFAVKMNLSLYTGFNANVYVPVSHPGVKFKSFVIDGVEYTSEIATIDGVDYHKISVVGITPANAGVPFVMTVGFTDGEVSRSMTLSFSVLQYIDKVLSNSESYSYESVTLVANILRYIELAYRYNEETANNYNEVYNLVEKYSFYFRFLEVEREKKSLTGIADGIESVQLNLKQMPRIRFNIKSGYTGVLKFSYISEGNTVNVSLNAEGGVLDNGKTYVELELRAYDFLGEINITTNRGSAGYDVFTYYTYHATEQSELTSFLNALLAYCDAAERYNNTKVVK